jgi:hypothetical protein
MKDTILKALFIAPFVVGAAWVNASEPMIWATPSGQPALVSDQAASRLAPTGFDQAQGRGR